jgi:hypothetical protein
MPGNKTHEHQVRQFENGGQSQNWAEGGDSNRAGVSGRQPEGESRELRQTDSPHGVSQQGMNQESRDHHKHNNAGQSGHKPQKHSPAEEKH